MLEVYLGNNTNTKQDLLTILTTYGVTYRCTKTKVSHGKERFQNFKKGKGFTRQKTS